jgi:predicted membrane chloride channel (bestrophin family)
LNPVFLARAKLFPEKGNQKERIESWGWALVIMVSVSSKLVTLILFIAAISLSGCFVRHWQNAIKRFFRIKPKSIPSVFSGLCPIFLSTSSRMYA